MKKLHSEKGFSRVEIFCIISITIMMLFVVCMGFRWNQRKQGQAEDKLLLNNAESVATIETAHDSCPVRECDGGADCTHKQADGSYVGYFGHPLNTIQGDMCAGYNACDVMVVGDEEYQGALRTMIIKVTSKDGKLTFSWVKGLDK